MACASIAYFLAISASAPLDWTSVQGVETIVGAVLTVAAVGLPALDQRRRDREVTSARSAAHDAKSRLQTALNDSLAPVVQQIGKVASAVNTEQREALCFQAVSKVLTCAVNLTGPGPARRRACWYALTQDGGRRVLKPVDHHGRSVAPSTVFEEGTVEGNAIFAALDRGEGRIVESIATDPPTGWDANRVRGYQTFIAVPVATDGRCFGMLTLDSECAGDLQGQDVPVVRLLADLLADALAIRINREHVAAIPGQLPVDLRNEPSSAAGVRSGK